MFIEMVCAAAHTPASSPAVREIVELMYEFEQPLLLDARKFTAAFREFAFSPHQEAVRQTVEWFRDAGLRLAAMP